MQSTHQTCDPTLTQASFCLEASQVSLPWAGEHKPDQGCHLPCTGFLGPRSGICAVLGIADSSRAWPCGFGGGGTGHPGHAKLAMEAKRSCSSLSRALLPVAPDCPAPSQAVVPIHLLPDDTNAGSQPAALVTAEAWQAIDALPLKPQLLGSDPTQPSKLAPREPVAWHLAPVGGGGEAPHLPLCSVLSRAEGTHPWRCPFQCKKGPDNAQLVIKKQ